VPNCPFKENYPKIEPKISDFHQKWDFHQMAETRAQPGFAAAIESL